MLARERMGCPGPLAGPSRARSERRAVSRLVVLLHDCLRGGRWLLPWISMLLVSVSLAYAMNDAVSGSRESMDGRSERSLAPGAGDYSPSSAVANVHTPLTVDLACISGFATYNSLVDAPRLCSMRGTPG